MRETTAAALWGGGRSAVIKATAGVNDDDDEISFIYRDRLQVCWGYVHKNGR